MSIYTIRHSICRKIFKHKMLLYSVFQQNTKNAMKKLRIQNFY